jgi:hypothetical protein
MAPRLTTCASHLAAKLPKPIQPTHGATLRAAKPFGPVLSIAGTRTIAVI